MDAIEYAENSRRKRHDAEVRAHEAEARLGELQAAYDALMEAGSKLRDHVDKRTEEMMMARRSSDKMRGAMARMIGIVAGYGDSDLFARVMGCMSQEDMAQMGREEPSD